MSNDEPERWLTQPGVAARLKSDRAVPLAKRLRKQMTPAEKELWSVLRRIAPQQALGAGSPRLSPPFTQQTTE